MANNNIGGNENIHVKVDQNNLIFIDPGTVVDKNGELHPRLVNQENLVMYVNLEADLIPRSTLFSEGNKTTVVSIAGGKLNFLRNNEGGDYNTAWTESYVPPAETVSFGTIPSTLSVNTNNGNKYDSTGQSFGIDSITIVTKGVNAIPEVAINFIDVRGKTLFESPENSPYKAFFHLPWPIFYLTVKGYYGKAIRYRLHMVDFKSKFNSNTGNFEINCRFIGSTFAFLDDIKLQNMLAAPYMYLVETVEPYRENVNTGLLEKKVSKTTKGYSILKSVYDSYKQKKLIPQNFPVKTLKDLIMTAQSAERLLESEIFQNKVDFRILGSVKQYETTISAFSNAINAWKKTYLNLKSYEELTKGFYWFPLNKAASEEDKKGNVPSLSSITGNTGQSLYKIIYDYKEKAYGNEAFGEKLNQNLIKDKDIKLSKISFSNVLNVMQYVQVNEKIFVNIDQLEKDIANIQNEFETQRNQLEDTLEEKMNTILEKDKRLGFGFKPSIRNIFAVILANADTYIRLMKDVHFRAAEVAKERQELLTNQKLVDNKIEGLYPWPQIKKQANSTTTIMYPGDKDISGDIKAKNPRYWPEVEFIELYEAITTKRIDPLTQNEIDLSKVNFLFPEDADDRIINNVSTGLGIYQTSPYINKILGSILYEITDRTFFSTLFDSFSTKAIENLIDKEFENLNSAIKDDVDVKTILSGPIWKNYSESGISGYEKDLYNNSPFDRYPYYNEKLSTFDYIKEIINSDFTIEEYSKIPKKQYENIGYTGFTSELQNYNPEEYRLSLYPFNSKTYLRDYLGRKKAKKLQNSDFKYANILNVNVNQSFVSSPIEPKSWIKKDTYDKFLLQSISLSGTSRNILNTPYFHKQLYSDFFKGGYSERYAGSAYLFLNSLPFLDLDEEIVFNNNSKILLSSLFREVGSTHFIPYHLILKWGSQYHRYKKYLLYGEDIISGVTSPINTLLFYDNSSGNTFTFGDYKTTYSGSTSAFYSSISGGTSGHTTGVYPLYQDIFYQIVNGYLFFDPGVDTGSEQTGVLTLIPSGLTTNFKNSFSNGVLNLFKSEPTSEHGFNFSFFVDNTTLKPTENYYTILPSSGKYTERYDKIIDKYKFAEQDSFKIIWAKDESTKFPNYSGLTMPHYNEYFKSISGTTSTPNVGNYSIDTTKRKVIDLIATFSPQLLDEFEKMFLEFTDLSIKTDGKLKSNDYYYNSFQELLKEISTVSKNDVTEISINKFSEAQTKKLKEITEKIFDNKNIVKITIGNPKQLDPYVLYGVAGLNPIYSDGSIDISQATQQNLNLIKLYIGEDIDNLYFEYFYKNNIELNEENILRNRELARIYAGYVTNELYANTGFTATKASFIQYLKSNIIEPHAKRYEFFFNGLMKKISKFPPYESDPLTIFNGYNTDKTIKVETYNTFKEFNDKWVAGNSLGQKNLLEDFLFLDRANKDIGDELFLSLDRLKWLSNPMNASIGLYSIISTIIAGNNIDFRPLPAYVNFYGTNFNDKKKITPSNYVAKNLFGTFLEVDYQEASPKMILQYVGPSSKYLKMTDVDGNKKDYKYTNDGADIRSTTRNPFLITQEAFSNTDFEKSNRVVGFEVNFGDQGQNIFKTISLDQSSKKPTAATFYAYENLGRSSAGTNTYQVDANLFDAYRTYAYACEVTAMGNSMIQPTMYFYLNNIPMFEGSYLITEVTHNIRQNAIETTFKGGRVPVDSLPNPRDSFVAAYRPLFDKIIKSAMQKKQKADNPSVTEQTIQLPNNQKITFDPGPGGLTNNETVVPRSGYLLGIPYNDQDNEKYIQLVNLENIDTEKKIDGQWLRARVCRMGGPEYQIDDDIQMNVVTTSQSTKVIKWKDIKTYTANYFSTRFNFSNTKASSILSKDMIFYNPNRGISDGKNPYVLDTNINVNSNIFEGAVHNGLPPTDFGIAMSRQLMSTLGLSEGNVVYFKPKT